MGKQLFVAESTVLETVRGGDAEEGIEERVQCTPQIAVSNAHAA